MTFRGTCLLLAQVLLAVASAHSEPGGASWDGDSAEKWQKIAAAGQIPTNQLAPLLQHILEVELSDDGDWTPAWSRLAETLHTNGQSPPNFWNQYLIDAVRIEVTVADNAKRSDGLPFWFIRPGDRAEFDGLNITLRAWLEDDISGIPIHGAAGALYPIEHEKLKLRSFTGSGGGNREALSNSAFASLQPGLQTYHYRYHIELFEGHVPLDTTNAPMAVRVIEQTLPWRLVAENTAPPLPALQTNASLHDVIQQSIRLNYLLRDTRDKTLVELSIQADAPPADSAFDVAIKVGDRTWPLGPVAWMKGKIQGWWFEADLPEDIRSVDVVFIPSASAGARLKAEDPFRITRLEQIWNGPPIILTNVPIQQQEISMVRTYPPAPLSARNDALAQFDASDPVIQRLRKDHDWAGAEAELRGKSDPRSRYNFGCLEQAKSEFTNAFRIFVGLRESQPEPMSQNVQRQLRRICSIYLTRAQTNDIPSMSELGAAYEHGWGVGQAFQDAKRWYRDAANAGNVAAMRPLARLYESEIGAIVHTEAAHKWYRQETLAWYRKAAAGGDAEATLWLAKHNSN